MSASSEGWLSLRFDATLLPAGCAAAHPHGRVMPCPLRGLGCLGVCAAHLSTHVRVMPPTRPQLLAVELEPDNPRDSNAVLVLHSERCGVDSPCQHVAGQRLCSCKPRA